MAARGLVEQQAGGNPEAGRGSAASSWATIRPVATWRGVAPSARASAVERWASITVAPRGERCGDRREANQDHAQHDQDMVGLLVDAVAGGEADGLGTRRRVAWMLCCTASAATTMATATSSPAPVRTVRRMRRATTRSPSSNPVGTHADSAISHGRRAGGWAASRSARTVLVRAAWIAGTTVEVAATKAASAIASAITPVVGRGVGGLPTNPCPGTGERRCDQRAADHPRTAPASASSHVLGEQGGGDERRCGADRLEQPDSSRLLCHAAADEHRDTRDREHRQQKAADEQHLVVKSEQCSPRSRISGHGSTSDGSLRRPIVRERGPRRRSESVERRVGTLNAISSTYPSGWRESARRVASRRSPKPPRLRAG